MYIKRYIENIITQANKTFKVLYLGGPRQVGKTTVMSKLSSELKFNCISLDNLNIRRLAQEDPALFLQKYPAPLFIDEAQYAPQIFPYIKEVVDKKQQNGLYWLSGSQQFSLIKNITESLAGRVAILSLLGLSFAEINEREYCQAAFDLNQKISTPISPDINSAFQHIYKGSFPGLWVDSSKNVEIFFNSYLQTYLDRDLQELFKIGKINVFHKFLQLCAARTGQILNYSDLANNAGVSVNTAKEWISVLESSMLIYLLKPYYKNISKRIIKSPKLYFLDTGLAAYLSSWSSAETLMNGHMSGAFFETFVISEIIKSYLFRGKAAPIYYFRDKEKHEIDLIIEKDGKCHPIEIKIASLIQKKHLSNIKYFRKNTKQAINGAIISLAPERMPFDHNDEIIPVSHLC